MSDDEVVLVDDEDVPLTVDALLPVVVGKGRVDSLGLVAADGVVDKELRVVGGGGSGRNGGHYSARYPLGIGGGKTGLWLWDGGHSSFDKLFYLALGQSRLWLRHVRHRSMDRLLHFGGCESWFGCRRSWRFG